MVTIPQIVEKIVKRSAFLEEGLNKKIMNLSALARMMQPEIERTLYKQVETGAIIMALNRIAHTLGTAKDIQTVFINAPDIIIRSNLIAYTFMNSQALVSKHQQLLETIHRQKEFFSTITEGVFETIVIASVELEHSIKKIYQDEQVIFKATSLSSVTIRLPKENVDWSGVYYLIFKPLAWEGINIIEVVSTTHEVTLLFGERDIDRAFVTIKNLFHHVGREGFEPPKA